MNLYSFSVTVSTNTSLYSKSWYLCSEHNSHSTKLASKGWRWWWPHWQAGQYISYDCGELSAPKLAAIRERALRVCVCGVLGLVEEASMRGKAAADAVDTWLLAVSSGNSAAETVTEAPLGIAGELTESFTPAPAAPSVTIRAPVATSVAGPLIALPSCFCGVFCRLITCTNRHARC